jgi:hypothetical protein
MTAACHSYAHVQVLNQAPALLPYIPLLHLLPDIEGGDIVLKDVRAACLHAASGSIRGLMSDAAASIERLSATHGADTDGALLLHAPLSVRRLRLCASPLLPRRH